MYCDPGRQIEKMTSKLVTSVLAAFFPDQCTGCEQPLFVESKSAIETDHRNPSFGKTQGKYQRRWCADCWAELGLVDQLQCEFCGAGIRAVNPLGEGCPLCLSADLAIRPSGLSGKLYRLAARRGRSNEEPAR